MKGGILLYFKKLLFSGVIAFGIFAGSVSFVYGQSFSYTAQPGDTYWKISQKFNVSIDKLMALNNADQNSVIYVGQQIHVPDNSAYTTIHTVSKRETYWKISQKYGVSLESLLEANNAVNNSSLNVGDKIIIPAAEKTGEIYYTVQKGDTFWKISQKFGVNVNDLMTYNNANENTIIYIGQTIKIPKSDTSKPTSSDVSQSTGPYVTYTSYKVVKGDTVWNIALKFGIPQEELIKANSSINPNSLVIGQTLRIPVHHVPVKPTPGPQYGELLNWWTEAQYVIPVNAEFKVVDFYTGKIFSAKRTTGANHADCEPLTKTDANTMKQIWGGSFSWKSRPVVIQYNGRKIAASATSMPHAGNDSAPGGQYTSWRSDNYGPGINYDWVKNNGFDGHFDIHFEGSTRHNNGQLDATHQNNIKIAAGLK